jgi:hypothetical protein
MRKPAAADLGAELAAIPVGQGEVEHDQVEAGIGGRKPRLGLRQQPDRDRLELPFQGKLFRQRLRQRGIVLDDQYRARPRHSFYPCFAVPLTETGARLSPLSTYGARGP